jgi:hypothetical protein
MLGYLDKKLRILGKNGKAEGSFSANYLPSAVWRKSTVRENSARTVPFPDQVGW